MARRAVKNARKTKSFIEEAAERAAEQDLEVVEQEESPEQRDINFALGQESLLTDQEVDERDVFPEARTIGINRNKSITFRVYIDSEWVATKPQNYSWEKLRKDFPRGGNVKVVGVDRDNKFVASQTLQVAADEEAMELKSQGPQQYQERPSHGPLEILEVMKENQREAETKAQAQQGSVTALMAAIVQTQSQNQQAMMQMQQQTTQLLMTVMQENNKQTQSLILSMQEQSRNKGPDPMVTLVTTLLTQPKPKEEFGTLQLIKMLEDAKRDERTKTREDYKANEEKIKKIREELEEKSDAGEKETGLASIIKTFAPVLTKVIEVQGAGGPQPTPQQLQAAQAQARLAKPSRVDLGTQPAIRDARGPARPAPSQPMVVEHVPTPEELAQEKELKDKIFQFCVPDIGNALLQRTDALKTVLTVLEKLEKAGMMSQTVAKLFKVEDFYNYADQYSLSQEAKVWLKDFHEGIQRNSGKKFARPAAIPPNGVPVPGHPSVGQGPNGATPSPVAPLGGVQTVPGPGVGFTQPPPNQRN